MNTNAPLARLCLALACAITPLCAEPSLWSEGATGMAEVTSFENGLPMTLVAGKKKALGELKGWELRGDMLERPDLAEWSPPYSLQRRSTEARKSRPELVATASIHLGLGADKGTVEAPARGLVSELWPALGSGPGLLVAAWVVDSRVTQTQVIQLLSREALSVGDIHFFLKEDEMGGRPALLLHTAEAFVAPRARFDDPLMQGAWNACLSGRMGMLASAFDAGLKPGVTDRQGMSLLSLSAEAGLTRCIPLLLAAMKDLVAFPDKGGFTPLHQAARNGREQALLLLVASGVPTPQVTAGAPSALELAASRGHAACVDILFKRNEKVDTEAAPVLLAAAIDHGQREVAASILQGSGTTAMLAAPAVREVFLRCCKQGDTESVRLLLRYGFLLNDSGVGIEGLQAAASSGTAELARVLLAAKVPADTENAAGETPLSTAIISRNLGFARELLAVGAKPFFVRPNGDSLLHVAVKTNVPELVTLLLRAGVNMEPKDSQGHTPLALALLAGNKPCATVLLQGGSLMPLTGTQFEELLEVALRMDIPLALRSLQKQGWNAEQALEGGWPVLRAAGLYGAVKCEALLQEAGLAAPESVPCPVLAPAELDARMKVVKAMQVVDPRPETEVYPRQTLSIEMIVDQVGRPRFAHLRNCPDLRLEQAVLAGIQEARFEPPLSKGKPVAVKVVQTLTFPSSKDRGTMKPAAR